MNSIQTSLIVKFLMIGLLIGKLNGGLVPASTQTENNKHGKNIAFNLICQNF